MGTRLLDVDGAVLCVIDVQPGFADKLEDRIRTPVVQRIAWLAAVAAAMAVPVVVTEEEPDRLGRTLSDVLERIPATTLRHTKPTFGLADVPEILHSVQATGRRTMVLVGMETDVCVEHSALGLLDRGYRVAAVHDAVASPGRAHEEGLARMRDAGVLLLGTKGLFYEWVRTVDRARLMGVAMADVPLPEGLTL